MQNSALTAPQSSVSSDSALCQACGACCAYSHEWPRFTLETDAEIERIPAALIDDSQSRMRCEGERCAALSGEIGIASACTIYQIRPIVCRDCLPGDDACTMARAARGWAAIERSLP